MAKKLYQCIKECQYGGSRFTEGELMETDDKLAPTTMLCFEPYTGGNAVGGPKTVHSDGAELALKRLAELEKELATLKKEK